MRFVAVVVYTLEKPNLENEAPSSHCIHFEMSSIPNKANMQMRLVAVEN